MALRIQYLMKTKEGAESHTVLVTDIPVLEFGTIPHRIETTVLRYLPVRIKVGYTACSVCCHSCECIKLSTKLKLRQWQKLL